MNADIIVAGGGVAGVLLASGLGSRGYSCLLVEPNGIAAVQSGHSHGYLHQGYIYLRAQHGLVDKLKSSREIWSRYFDTIPNLTPEVAGSIIGFHNPNTAKMATQMWKRSGLPIDEIRSTEWPRFLRSSPITSAFKTTEAAYNFPQILNEILSMAPNVRYVKGAVRSLRRVRNQCREVEIFDGISRGLISARYVLLAGGSGNWSILFNTFGFFRAVPTVRTSYMLVLCGAELPLTSIILPENDPYGIFLVSRKSNGLNVWLVSNYLSFCEEYDEDSLPARTWTLAMLRRLRRYFPSINLDALRIGIYAAPKAELRRDPERLPEDKVIEDYGLENVTVVWPTKLTLAPYIVSEIEARVVRALGKPSGVFNGGPSGSAWVVHPEKWTLTEILSFDDFLGKMKISSVKIW